MQPGALCELELGVILRRRCPEQAATFCQSCGKRVCEQHHRQHAAAGQAAMPWCIDCLRKHARPLEPTRRNEPFSHSASLYDNTALGVASESLSLMGSSGSSEAFQGAGGAFGGAGASGSWDDAEGFSAADYAAFDRTVEADRHDAGGSYDS